MQHCCCQVQLGQVEPLVQLAWLALALQKPMASLRRRQTKEKEGVCSWIQKFKKSTAYCLITCRDLSPKLVAELVGTQLCGFEGGLKQLAHMVVLHGREGGIRGAAFGGDTFAQHGRRLAGGLGQL